MPDKEDNNQKPKERNPQEPKKSEEEGKADSLSFDLYSLLKIAKGKSQPEASTPQPSQKTETPQEVKGEDKTEIPAVSHHVNTSSEITTNQDKHEDKLKPISLQKDSRPGKNIDFSAAFVNQDNKEGESNTQNKDKRGFSFILGENAKGKPADNTGDFKKEEKNKKPGGQQKPSGMDFSAAFSNQQQPSSPEPLDKKNNDDKPERSSLDLSGILNQLKSDKPKEHKDNYSYPDDSQSQNLEIPKDYSDEVDNVYNSSLALAKDVFDSEVGLTKAHLDKIHELVNKMIGMVGICDQCFLEYIFNPAADNTNFVALHMVNTCILALELGIGLNYTKDQQLKIGVAAFLQGIGLKKHRDMIGQKRVLSNAERKKMQQHPMEASEILKLSNSEIDREACQIIEQQHERIDGSGYPRGLKNGEIKESAQVIGIVDVYEALTHKRPYRDKYSPIDALKVMMENKIAFSPRITKAFLNRIGFYPNGTYVELNTKEIAQVIKQNPTMPSCPVVLVTHDSKGNKLEQPRDIDLSIGTKIYITKSI